MPDPEDRHVPAAPIRCNASVIVTFNQRDFPDAALSECRIGAQHPDEFIDKLFDLDQAAVVGVAQRQRAQLPKPKLDVERYLDVLLKQGLVQTARALAPYRSIL